MNIENKEPNLGAEKEQEVSREIVEAIEKSAFALPDKVNILLVKAGVRPASWLTLYTHEEYVSGTKIDLAEEEIEESRELLKRLFPFEERKPVVDEGKTDDEKILKYEHVDFMIGSTKENVERLSSAVYKNDEREIGLALGYCETAVDAYCGEGEVLDISKLPMEIQMGEAMEYNPGVLSVEHWQEELEQYQKWADCIRMNSSNLYNQMIAIGVHKAVQK